MSELWRAGDLEIFAAGERTAILFDRATGRTRSVAAEDARLIASCDGYAPLEQHAARWIYRNESSAVEQFAGRAPKWMSGWVRKAAPTRDEAAEKAGPLVAKLKEWAAQGFLVPLSGLLQSPAQTTEPPPITTYGFTTRNRPVELERAIRSYVDNARKYGREIGITIIDESQDEAGEEETRLRLAALAAELDAPVRFAGRTARAAWAAELSRETGVEEDVVRFALLGDTRCPRTTGSARNSLLLDAVGESYVLADDDGVCRAARNAEYEEGWALTSVRDPTEFWFYRTCEETAERTDWIDADVAALHERLLGREVASLWTELGELSVGSLSAELDRRVRSRGLRVRASMAGVVGDSGLGGSAYLFTGASSRGRLTESEEYYREVVASRQVLRAPRRLTVADSTICMAGNLGLDHSLLLPPFVPVQRNSDGLFGRLLRRCFPRSAMGYLPEAVWHDPIDVRRQEIGELFDVERGIRFPDYLIRLIAEWPGAEGAEPGEALASLGRFLTRAARRPQREFEAVVRRRILASEAPRLARDRSREAEQMPKFYADLRKKQLDVLHRAIEREDYLTPRDLVESAGGPEQARALARELTERTGRLLEAWSATREAAWSLKDRGRRLTEALGPHATSAAGAR